MSEDIDRSMEMSNRLKAKSEETVNLQYDLRCKTSALLECEKDNAKFLKLWNNEREKKERIALQLSEARELLQEGMTWAGRDPDAEEAHSISVWEQKTVSFLDKSGKLAVSARLPSDRCFCGGNEHCKWCGKETCTCSSLEKS